jgi:hypothetical protein
MIGKCTKLIFFLHTSAQWERRCFKFIIVWSWTFWNLRLDFCQNFNVSWQPTWSTFTEVEKSVVLEWWYADESNSTLRMTDKEYKGQRSILNTTRYMLTSMQRQDVIDRCFPFICMHFSQGWQLCCSLAFGLQFSGIVWTWTLTWFLNRIKVGIVVIDGTLQDHSEGSEFPPAFHNLVAYGVWLHCDKH